MSSRSNTSGSSTDARPSYALPGVAGLAAQDDWTKADNPKERKKLQNRVAQRIYRQRVKTRLQELQDKIDAQERANSNNFTSNSGESRPDNCPLPSPAASNSTNTPANQNIVSPADLEKVLEQPQMVPGAATQPAHETSYGNQDAFDFQPKMFDTPDLFSGDLSQADKSNSEWAQRPAMPSHDVVRDLLALQADLINKLNTLQSGTDFMSHLPTPSNNILKKVADLGEAEMANCHSVAMPEVPNTMDFTTWRPNSTPEKPHMDEEEEEFNSHMSDTPSVPGKHDSLNDRFEFIMDRVEAVGYDNFDRLVTAYYSETFPQSSPLYNEQWLSRNRRLPQVLSEIFSSSAGWTSKQRQGLNEEILKMTESVLTNEGNGVHATLESKSKSLNLNLNDSSEEPETQDILDLKGFIISELPNLWSLSVGLASANPNLRQKDRSNIALAVTLLLHFGGRFPKDKLVKVLNACL